MEQSQARYTKKEARRRRWRAKGWVGFAKYVKRIISCSIRSRNR